VKPFLQWVGGKSRLLPEILDTIGKVPIRTYYEPFLGSGAVALALIERSAAKSYRLSDACTPLVEAWQHAEPDLVEQYGRAIVDVETYRMMRAAHNSGLLSLGPRAAVFVALNHTCFNGLWRVNGRGWMNVPYGHKSPNWAGIAARVAAWRAWAWRVFGSRDVGDFEDAIRGAGEGDLVYCDPPYYDSAGEDFHGYTAGGFGLEEHLRLEHACARAAERGARVLVSQGDGEVIRSIWSYPRWLARTVEVMRSVAAKGSARAPARELLLKSW